MLATFGGSGSLLACRLVDILDLAGVVVPQNPGNVSAFGLLTVDVKNDYVQTAVAKHASLDHAAVQKTFDELTDKAAKALDAEGFPRDAHRYTRTVDLRYFGQAFEVRVTAPEGVVDEAYAAQVADAFHAEHRALYGYDFRGDPQPAGRVGQPARHRRRPDHPPRAARARHRRRRRLRSRAGPQVHPPGLLRRRAGYVETDVYWRPDLRAGDTLAGPAIVEEFGSTVPVHPGFTVRVDAIGNLVITKEA